MVLHHQALPQIPIFLKKKEQFFTNGSYNFKRRDLTFSTHPIFLRPFPFSWSRNFSTCQVET